MARYLNVPQQNLVNMYTPLNVGFYSGILDKAQQNLNEATKIQSAYEDEIYNIKAFDQATKDVYINKAKQIIGNELDKEFVSPSSVVRSVARASKELAPWRNLNQLQIENTKRMQEQQDRWGSNWIGNDISKLSLRNPTTGELINSKDLELISGNREDFIQALAKDYGARAGMVRPGAHGQKNLGDFTEFWEEKIKGMTKEEIDAEFKNNPQLVQKYQQQMPGLAAAIKASGQDPTTYMADEMYRWAQQLNLGSEIDRSHAANREKIQQPTIPPYGINFSTRDLQDITSGDKELLKLISAAQGKPVETEFKYGDNQGVLPGSFTGSMEFSWMDKATSLTKLKDKFSLLLPIAKSNEEFLNMIRPYAEEGAFYHKVVDYNNRKNDEGFARVLNTAVGSDRITATTVDNPNGNRYTYKDVTSGKGKKAVVGQLISNGDILYTNEENKQYIVHSTDKNGKSTGLFNNQISPLAEMLKFTTDNQFKYLEEGKTFTPGNTITDIIPGTGINGINAVYYTPSYKIKTVIKDIVNDDGSVSKIPTNIVYKYYNDVNTGTPHNINGSPAVQEISLGQAKAEAINYIGIATKSESSGN